MMLFHFDSFLIIISYLFINLSGETEDTDDNEVVVVNDSSDGDNSNDSIISSDDLIIQSTRRTKKKLPTSPFVKLAAGAKKIAASAMKKGIKYALPPSLTKKRPAQSQVRDKTGIQNQGRNKKPKKATKKGGGKRTDKIEGAGDDMDSLIKKLLKQKLALGNTKPTDNPVASIDPVASIVQLSVQFKVMSDNLGSKVKAANVCPAFEQFLDAEEIVELRELKDEILAAKSADC